MSYNDDLSGQPPISAVLQATFAHLVMPWWGMPWWGFGETELLMGKMHPILERKYQTESGKY